MTPTAFYCWLQERSLLRGGMHPSRLRPDQNTSLSLPMVSLLLCVAWSFAFPWLSQRIGILPTALGLAALSCLLAHSAFGALAWNQRAAQIRQGAPVPVPPSPQLRWLLGPVYILVVSVATPLALVVSVENLRGALAWKAQRSRLIGQGEKLTFAEVLPPPVTPESNLATLPAFAAMFEYSRPNGGPIQWRNTNALKAFSSLSLPDTYLPTSAREPRGLITVGEWAVAFRAAISNHVHHPTRTETLPVYRAAAEGASPGSVVLTALSVGDEVLGPFCEASQRPHAQFPVHWNENFNALLPHLANGKLLSRHLALRVLARLAEGDVAGAFADARCSVRAAEIFREEPLLISQLVRIAQNAILAESIGAGIQAHRWTEPQLAEFQATFQAKEFVSRMAWALEGERAGTLLILEQIASRSVFASHADLEAMFEESEARLGLPLRCFPRGWVRQNQVKILDYQQRRLDLARRLVAESGKVGWSASFRETTAVLDRTLTDSSTTPYTVLFRLLAAATDRALAKAMRAEQTALLAATACALERYRVAQGTYPEALTSLVPRYCEHVPLDRMNGQPLHYARTTESFRLWSVGLDGVDNGGQRRMNLTDSEERGADWPWPISEP